MSALMLAAFRGHENVVDQLTARYQFGININEQNKVYIYIYI